MEEVERGEGFMPDDADESASQSGEVDGYDGGADNGYDAAGAALGVLSPEEAAAVLAAAENDPALAVELAELQAVVAELSRMGPVTSINRGRSAGIRSRLVTRAAASRAGRPVTRQSGPLASMTPPRGVSSDIGKNASAQAASTARSERRGTTRLSTERRTTSIPVAPSQERRGRFWKRTLGALAAAAIVLTAAGIFELWRDRDTRGGTAAVAVATSSIATHDSLFRTVLTLREELARRDSMIAALRNPATHVVELASFAPPTPPGRAFWDQRHQHLMLSINGLKTPASGRTYQLWVMARGHAQPMSAGTFIPDSAGHADMTMQVPIDPGQLRRVVVTDEPMGGSPAPTGPILFAGR